MSCSRLSTSGSCIVFAASKWKSLTALFTSCKWFQIIDMQHIYHFFTVLLFHSGTIPKWAIVPIEFYNLYIRPIVDASESEATKNYFSLYVKFAQGQMPPPTAVIMINRMFCSRAVLTALLQNIRLIIITAVGGGIWPCANLTYNEK